MTTEAITSADKLPPGTIVGVPGWAVGNTGTELFAVSRRCRHLAADLANGSIDADGCLVCPWHGSRYDVRTGRMTRGPQGIFARIPGFDALERGLTAVWPLRRRPVAEREGAIVFVDRDDAPTP
jgi:nitrite reductase/ring-hydroxylating ferredoxin subunit